MLKKIVLAAALTSAMLVGVPQAAVAGPYDCALNCMWVTHYDWFGNPVGGHWECPDLPDVAECVEL